MKVSELLKDWTAKTDFVGPRVHNDMVLAINTTPGTENVKVADYAVVQIQIEGTDAELNPETSEKVYIRSGKNTNKTGTQRGFSITGERYIGDEAQDYMFKHEIKYGSGADVITDYVYFDMMTGVGEKGTVAIIVNSDGGGDASSGLEIDVELLQNGGNPSKFTYSPTA